MKITWLYGIMRQDEYGLGSGVTISKHAFVAIEKSEDKRHVKYWIYYNKKLELLYGSEEVNNFVDFYSTPIFKLLA